MHRVIKLLILSLFFLYNNDAYCVSIIRDTEVEAVVKELAKPLFSAAGIDYKQIKIFVINDNSVNAFVINNDSIFINLGLLQYSTKPYVLLGILAHEIAHISAGHVLQTSKAVNYFNSIAIISYMLGLASGIMIDPQIASAVLIGGVGLSTKLFSNYSQDQESAADSYALRYLDESRYDNIGIKEAFSYFKSIEHKDSDEYFRTHPLSDKRLFIVQNYKVKNDVRPISAEKLLKFERVIVKLDSFFAPIHVLSSKYNNNDRVSQYVNAIVKYRRGKIEEAVNSIDLLMQQGDPYLYQLKAEMLYKVGNLVGAIENYEESLKYISNKESYLIKIALSHALLLYGDAKKAVLYLEQITNLEPNDILAWKYLSVAYKCYPDIAMYYFALTKKAFIEDDMKKFKKYSQLAIHSLPKDSSYLLQVEDMKNHSGK